MTQAQNFETVSCTHEDRVLRGRLYRPLSSGPHPGVLVVHTAFGLGGHIPQIAERLAAQGYAALAVDMYGDGAYSEDERIIGELVRPVWGNSPVLRGQMQAWLDLLRADTAVIPDRIAAIGYCFGGQCVLELARGGGDVRAVVSFHGILTTAQPAERGAIRATMAVHTGARDPHAPVSDVAALRAELTAAEANWHIAEYGNAYHAFTDPEARSPQTGRAYDALADHVSWASTLSLLAATLR
jgi:dienelactone hydrolase